MAVFATFILGFSKFLWTSVDEEDRKRRIFGCGSENRNWNQASQQKSSEGKRKVLSVAVK